MQETHSIGRRPPTHAARFSRARIRRQSMTTIRPNYANFRSCWPASWRIGSSLHRGMWRIDSSGSAAERTGGRPRQRRRRRPAGRKGILSIRRGHQVRVQMTMNKITIRFRGGPVKGRVTCLRRFGLTGLNGVVHALGAGLLQLGGRGRQPHCCKKAGCYRGENDPGADRRSAAVGPRMEANVYTALKAMLQESRRAVLKQQAA